MVVPLGRIILLFCFQIPNAKYCISFGEHISYTQEIANLKSLISPSTVPGYEKLSHFLDINNANLTSHTVVLSAYVLRLSLSPIYQENQAFRIFQEITLHKGGKEKKMVARTRIFVGVYQVYCFRACASCRTKVHCP